MKESDKNGWENIENYKNQITWGHCMFGTKS